LLLPEWRGAASFLTKIKMRPLGFFAMLCGWVVSSF
jgi:hypothetical protein